MHALGAEHRGWNGAAFQGMEWRWGSVCHSNPGEHFSPRDSCFHCVRDAVNQGLALCVRMLGFQTCDTVNRQYSQWSAGHLSFPQASSSSGTGCGAKDGQRMK